MSRVRVRKSEVGQDAAEYSLLLGLIAIGLIGSIVLIGGNLAQMWDTIQSSFAAAFS